MESLVRREEGTSSSECIYIFLLEGRQVHALRRTGTFSSECRIFTHRGEAHARPAADRNLVLRV